MKGLSNQFLVCTAFSLAIDVVAGVLSSQQLEELAEVGVVLLPVD